MITTTTKKEQSVAEIMYTLKNGLRFSEEMGKRLSSPRRPLDDILNQPGLGEASFNLALGFIRGAPTGVESMAMAMHYASALMRELAFEGHRNALDPYVSQFEQALRESPYIN